ncbi:histidinol-phosphate transaminase [Amycolatopsis sp. NPDC021455]|uniref:histidinol-phosphate transaminase n=1 Tax=Amycolatopsis sp. NPDC021455 TaxID=3154901 RepID=UPI0033EA57E2
MNDIRSDFGRRHAGERPAHVLSMNESPYAPLPSVLRTLNSALGRVNRYPDPTCTELALELARRHQVPDEHVVVGPGSLGVARQLVRAVAARGPGEEMIYPWRSFEGFAALSRMTRMTGVRIPLDTAYRQDLEAMADRVTEQTRLVFLCNPNNPTGTAIADGELRRFLDRVPERVVVVVDEAYHDYATDPAVASGVDLCHEYENLVVLKTFSVAHGLADLRVGYAIAAVPLVDLMHEQASPFAVSTLGQQAALASLAAETELRARIRRVVDERGRITEGLRTMGYDVPESQGNFVWLPLGGCSVDFALACRQAGVDVKLYPEGGVRISVGLPEANDALLDVVARTTAMCATPAESVPGEPGSCRMCVRTV